MDAERHDLDERNQRAARLASQRGWLDAERVDALVKLGQAWGQDLVEGALQASWLTSAQADELREALGFDETEPAAPPPTRMPRGPGEVVGDYEVVRRLGAGAMGTVFEAKHLQAGLHHALKLVELDGQSREHVQRFLREGEALGRVSHPAVVRIHACQLLPGELGLLAMDLVPGQNLERLLRPGPLPVDEALALGAQLARALQALHAAGIVHRDLKPANVIVHEETGQPVLCDFGVVHDLFRSTRLTQTGQLLGSPLYMAPEQILGERAAIGPATDVFSLGVILYRSLTGLPPFEADTLVGLAGKILEGRPEPLRSLRPQVPRPLARRIEAALAKRPGDRPNAGELADDLERLVRGEGLIAGRPLPLLLGLTLALVALAIVGWVAFPSPTASAPPPSPPSARVDPPAEPEPPPPTPREAALAKVLAGDRDYDEQLLSADERRWANLELERRALDAEVGSLGSDATYYQAANRRSGKALELGYREEGLPPTEALTDEVRTRLAETLLNVILDVPHDLKKAETVALVKNMAAKLLPPGDLRPSAVLDARHFYDLLEEGELERIRPLDRYGPRWAALSASMRIVRDFERRGAFMRWVPGFEPLQAEMRGHMEIGLCNRACRSLSEVFEVLMQRSLTAEPPHSAQVLRERWQGFERFNRAALVQRLHLGVREGEALTNQWLQQARVWLYAGDPARAREALRSLPATAHRNAPGEVALHTVEVLLLEGKPQEARGLVDRIPPKDRPGARGAVALALGLGEKAALEALTRGGATGEDRVRLPWRTPEATRRLIADGIDLRQPLWQALRERAAGR